MMFQIATILRRVFLLCVIAIIFWVAQDRYESLSKLFSKGSLIWIYDHRVGISALLILALGIWLFLSRDFQWSRLGRSSSAHAQGYYVSQEDLILAFEAHRINCGYDPSWLYDRCVAVGLEDCLQQLIDSGVLAEFQRTSGYDPNIEADQSHQDFDQATDREQAPSQARPTDPYAILGVRRDASAAEIKKGYYEMLKLYHPDRVHELGPKLQQLAKEMTAQLNAAFEELERSNKQ